jgi:hypothetical protein
MAVSEKVVLRRIFGFKKQELTGELRYLHNEVLHDLYSSSNIVRVIKSRRIRWRKKYEKFIKAFNRKI